MADRNKETIDKAIDIYRDAMRSYIASVIRKVEGKRADNAIMEFLPDKAASQYARNRKEKRTIEGSLDLLYLPRLAAKYWRHLNVSQDKATVIYLMRDIVNARNSVAHPDTHISDKELEDTLKLINDSLDDFKLSKAKALLQAINDSKQSSDNNEVKFNIEQVKSDINALNAKYDNLSSEISVLRANVDNINEDHEMIIDHITKADNEGKSSKNKNMKRALPAPVMPEVSTGVAVKNIKRRPPWFNPPKIR